MLEVNFCKKLSDSHLHYKIIIVLRNITIIRATRNKYES